MKPIHLLAVTALATGASAGAQSFELGLTGGYANGLSGEAFIHSPNLIGPVGVKFGVSYARAADAIKDSSDLGAGTFASYKASGATESGTHTIVGLDATYGLGELAPGIDTTLYAGARYGMFRSTEDYGSNINATYSTNAFGVGGGVMVGYALTGNLSLVADLGADYFFNSTINQVNNTASGQTTASYATNDPNYGDISNRFVRPGIDFKARIGIKYVF
ncbi:hypothetical protein HNQ07_000497 [Deinococcus metalli]|nr:hypothetical protein [Deinococcus metalli]MBB5375053.1 hypothetical protein [Deinococcus metalli]